LNRVAPVNINEVSVTEADSVEGTDVNLVAPLNALEKLVREDQDDTLTSESTPVHPIDPNVVRIP
jgi:hypothetical protein